MAESSPPEEALRQTLEKYKDERAKRLHPKGNDQFVDLPFTPGLKHLARDPWVDTTPTDQQAALLNQQHHRVLIVGAGFSGLLFAVKLIKAGAFTAKDILLVDTAGGFGGTWYWNRYPGLTCDIESYIYMPLLEETGHIPTKKYVSATELREYAGLIAQTWKLSDRGLFQTAVKGLTWDDGKSQWKADVVHQAGDKRVNVILHADFTILAGGFLNIPKVPKVPGLNDFNGPIFHTSRWDYQSTGGSPDVPELHKLKNKKVGIIGTGASAVQIVPHLAQWAKELFVFQRTPSAVEKLNNCDTTEEQWKTIAPEGSGWQKARMENFNAFLSTAISQPRVNMVDDGWTRVQTLSTFLGDALNMDPMFIHTTDMKRQEKIRQGVDEVVRDKATAEALKPWYPTWCKRPCFDDEYLQTFNRENVTLINTQGKGVKRLTERGVVVGDDKEYVLDMVILATGYNVTGRASPASRANITIRGRNGLSMDEKWENGVSTLYGIATHGFPNLFFLGTNQTGFTANQMYVADQVSTHVAHILAKVAEISNLFKTTTLDTLLPAEETWTRMCLTHVGSLAGMRNCTPGYINAEGEMDRAMDPMDQIQAARMAHFGGGVQAYVAWLEHCRQKDCMAGFQVDFGL